MAVSPVQICNMALARIGSRKRIESLTEASPEAIACNLWYETCRDAVLEEAPWPFAIRRVTLPLTGTPPDAWSYSYAIPVDCMRALYIDDSLQTRRVDQRIKFVIERDVATGGRLLYTDQDEAVLVYVSKVTDTTKYPAVYIDALGWRLAAELSIQLAVDHKNKIDARQLYESALYRAIALTQNEVEPPEDPSGEFDAARG